MIAKLYLNDSDARVLDKHLVDVIPQDAETNEVPINFLEDSSVINPTFIFTSATNILNANYIFVPDFGRYYYITNQIVSKNRIHINCHVDVLMSFSKSIKESWAILERQEKEFDLYLNDSLIPLENPNDIRTINFPSGFNEGSEFILIIAGDNSSGGE